MTLNEIIERENKIAEENQKIVDTHIIFDDVTVDEMYCDDTEVIEEHLENYRKCAEYHKQVAELLEDYKHIKQWKSDIMDNFCKYDASSFEELVTNARNKAIDDFATKIKKYMETTEQATYIEEINNGNDNYSAMTIYDYVDELANELKVGEQNE